MSANAKSVLNKIIEANRVYKKNPELARKVFDELYDKLPENVAVQVQFGHLATSLGEHIYASQCYAYAVAHDPANADYLALLATAYMYRNAYSDAEALFLKALDINPNHFLALANLGSTLFGAKRFEESLVYLERARALKPSDVSTYTNLAGALLGLGRQDEALEQAKTAIRKRPKNANAHYFLGMVYLELGSIDDAIDEFLLAIKYNKYLGAAYKALSDAKKYSKNDSFLIKSIEKTVREGMSAKERYPMYFALGKMYDDCGEWDKAFQYYRQANLMASASYGYVSPGKFFSQLKTVFNKESIRDLRRYGSESERPVFMVGMPRSGTTLTEQIIASHPYAAGGGELPYIRDIERNLCRSKGAENYIENCKNNLVGNKIAESAKEYLKYLSEIDEDAARVVDKMPGNYLHLGLIKSLFPNAKIIHMMRNPLDTCLSCYFQDFTFLSWTFDLDAIAKEYLFYRKVMDYWYKVLPGDSILEVHYENIIDAPETESRRIIDFLGLDWNEACLNFDKTERTVHTASVWQVRQPIYKTSRMRARHYAQHLTGLANKLQKYLPDDPEFRKEFGIKKRWLGLFG